LRRRPHIFSKGWFVLLPLLLLLMAWGVAALMRDGPVTVVVNHTISGSHIVHMYDPIRMLVSLTARIAK
jgi:hypothetical protein